VLSTDWHPRHSQLRKNIPKGFHANSHGFKPVEINDHNIPVLACVFAAQPAKIMTKQYLRLNANTVIGIFFFLKC